MPRYSEKQKAALDALMKDEVHSHASKIIKEEGVGSLTMERLATEVGVSRGTLYNYFDDRDAVLDYVEERTFGPVLAAVQEVATSDLRPEEKLTQIGEWIFTAIYQDRALVVALVPNKFSDANIEKKNRRHASALSAIETVVQQGMDAGIFRDLPSRRVSETFLGTVAGVIDSMALRGEFLPAEEVVPTMMAIFLRGLQRNS